MILQITKFYLPNKSQKERKRDRERERGEKKERERKEMEEGKKKREKGKKKERERESLLGCSLSPMISGKAIAPLLSICQIQFKRQHLNKQNT